MNMPIYIYYIVLDRIVPRRITFIKGNKNSRCLRVLRKSCTITRSADDVYFLYRRFIIGAEPIDGYEIIIPIFY